MVTFSADGAELVVNGTTDPSQVHQILYGVSTVDWSRLFEVRHTISWTTKVSRKLTGMVFLGSATVIMWGLNLVELWNVQIGQLEGRLAFGCNGGITSFALRHDEEQCALGFKDGRIEVWSVEALRREHQGDDGQGTQSVVCGVSITPDGDRLAVCYESGSVSIVDVRTGSEIVSREVFLKKVTVDSLFFTPDSRSVIVTYQEWGNTCVRRLAAMDLTDQALFENTTWEVVLRSLSMTPDGAGILTLRKSYADVNATVHELLELRTEDLVLLRSHRIPHEPQNWALWPDGSQIVWGANMHVWSLVKEREVFSVVSPVDKAVVFPDGMSVAATKRSFGAGNEIIVVSIGQGSTISIPEDRVVRPWGRVVQCSPDGRRLLLDDGVLIDVRSHRSMACDKSVPMIREVSYAFSSDGRRVYGLDGEFIYMWDSDSGACLTLLPLKRSGAFKWSTDGNVLVVAQGDILRVFRPVNIVQQPCIVTAVRLLDVVSKAWQRDVTVLCSRCGVRCAVPSAICDVIVSVNRSSGMSPQESPCLRLPDGAWEERGLYSECPHCHQVLRFNPFIVDNSDARRECW
jgi:WD40 repeat protein